jgi:hypothetical protein
MILPNVKRPAKKEARFFPTSGKNRASAKAFHFLKRTATPSAFPVSFQAGAAPALSGRRGREAIKKFRQPRLLIGGFVLMDDAVVDQLIEQGSCCFQIFFDGLPIFGGQNFFERRAHFGAIFFIPLRPSFGLPIAFDC